MRITRDLTNQIFKPMNQAPVEMNPVLANSLEPSLDDILLGNASKFPLFKEDCLINALYSIAIKIQTPDFFFKEMMENRALKSIQKKNEAIRAENAEKAVIAYRESFHRFNTTPTCFEQDSGGNLKRTKVTLTKDRKISRHFK